ncbi:MAG: hypothetical protein MZV64_27365 [Ignavibacteriales bacterium]|nr:hypothetical protein [Ignavibacteriales bacterium]
MPIEESFVETVKYCKANDIDIYIISAGADYYIQLILENLGVADSVTLLSNKSVYSFENGLEILELDINAPFYSLDYGISKKKAVETIKKQLRHLRFCGGRKP